MTIIHVWFLIYQVRRTEFFVILGHVLPFYTPSNPRNQNFEKMKKPSQDIMTYHMCTINDSHMMHGSRGMECDQHNFLSFWTVFFPFYPPNNPKNQNFEKMKKTTGDVIILHKCFKNHDYMLYCSLDMTCNGCNHYFSFWATFCPFTSRTAQKIKI